MCGILAYHSNKPVKKHFELFSSLFIASKIRGLHAFGVSSLEPDGITIATKKFHRVHDACDYVVNNLGSSTLPQSVIGHCRYSTSGDYKDHANNQPIHIGDSALVFNGVIDMGTKPEMEARFGITMETYNDGEIFLKHVASGGDPVEFISSMRGSFAGAYIKNGNIYALRNNRRPAYLCYQDGAVFVASTADIFFRAGFEKPVMLLEPNSLYCLASLL